FIAQAKTRKPVIAYVSDLCASGAYWLASQCSSIIANESAFVGSIGVYSVLIDQSKAAVEFGYRIVLVSDGEFKGLTEPGLPVGDKAVAETQRIVGSIANLFRAAVGRGRGLDDSVVSTLADGRVHVAAEALGLRLIDGIGPLDCAVNFGGQEMNTPANAANAAQNKGAKPQIASDGTDGASGGDGSAPDLAELCGKILDAINAQTEMIKKLVPADDSGGGKSDDGSGSADDASAHARLTPAQQLKAIMDVCPGRAEFAMTQFTAGKTPLQAQAALALVLAEENKQLKQKIAAEEDGANPIAGAQPANGGARAVAGADETDPEKIWEHNVGDVQKVYRGNKKYFLSAFKHEQTPAQIAAKNAAKAA
ncbi:MAG: S49 family peptidase, partial [Stellaceae bacterium]